MFKAIAFAAAISLSAGAAAAQAPNDAQIAHIAYTAGVVDIAAGKQALGVSHNKAVIDFANEMVRDHGAVNDQARHDQQPRSQCRVPNDGVWKHPQHWAGFKWRRRAGSTIFGV